MEDAFADEKDDIFDMSDEEDEYFNGNNKSSSSDEDDEEIKEKIDIDDI